MLTTIDFTFSNYGTRNQVRMRVVNKFSEEIPGKGKGEFASKYLYYVENLSDARRIYLKRPAFNHNGFDFVIHAEDYIFSNGKSNPKHQDIIDDLMQKKSEEPDKYKELFHLIRRVYECKDLNSLDYESLFFQNGYSIDLILKVIKWFFIEQDIRYWNYSGREMLMSGIPEPE